MKRAIFILPVFAALFCWIAAQQPSSRIANPGKIASPAAPAPDTVLPGEPPLKTDIAGFLAGEFRQALGLTAADSLLLLSIQDDRSGGRHARVQQLRHGIPVFGAWYAIHEKNGAIVSINGKVFPELEVKPEPALSEAEALEKATAALPASLYAWQDEQFETAQQRQKRDPSATFYPKGELVIVPENLVSLLGAGAPGEEQPAGDKGFRLAWRFDIFAVEPKLKRELVFIDAIDGRVLHRLPQMAFCHAPALGKAAYRPGLVEIATDSCNGTGTPEYCLHDVLRDIEIFNAGNSSGTPLIRFCNDTTLWIPPQADTVAVAAMHGLEIWYDYLLDNFGWRGFDGLGEGPIQAWVHYRNNFDNAVYAGFLLFGDGNPNGDRKTPLVPRDVVAHEASHGLIENTAGLLYVYEPGILNEAVADIIACLVELEQGGGNWILGEDIIPGGERRLDAPHLMGLPDTYQGDFWITQSAPGQALHRNSTVLGHWFYLLAEGGAGVNDMGTPYSVAAMGRDKAAELLFHTMRYFLNPNDGFFGMRRATMSAAGTAGLNWNQDEVGNLAMAWCAVGVGGCEAQGNETVTLLSPNGGEEYYPGNQITVKWENTSGVTHLKVFISANGGASWQEIAYFPISGTADSMAVNAPNVNSRLCRIRVAAANEPLAFDDSDSTFSIIGCSLLSSFTVLPESGCPGTSFTVDNTSLNQDADFSWLVDGQPYPAVPGGFTLLAPEPGPHTITLVAKDSVCIDTFRRVVQVAPAPSAAFSVSVSNQVVTATAAFPDGEQYFWSVGGQPLPLFNGSQSLAWTAPDTGTFEVCLFVGDNCSFGGEQACQTVSVSASENCIGTDETWKQYNNKSDIIDMAEYGDTIIMSTTGGLVFFNKTTEQVVKVLNTTTSPALPCQGLGSIAVDSVNKWVYVALEYGKGLIRIDLTSYTITQFTMWDLQELHSNDINVLRMDPLGNLWIGTNDGGIWVGIPGISFQKSFRTDLPETEIKDIDFQSDSMVWVGMRRYLAKIENDSVTTVFSPENSPLSTGYLNAIMVDSNIVWVGTVNGLHRLEAGNWQTFDYADYGQHDNVSEIIKGDNGTIIFGLERYPTIIEYDGNSFNVNTCFYNSLNGGAGGIKRLIFDDDKVWMGCEFGLYSWDENNGCQEYPISDFPIFRNLIRDILLKSDGTVYVVEDQSMVKINGDVYTPLDIAPYLPFGPNYLPYLDLYRIVEGDNGTHWVALKYTLNSETYYLARINSPPSESWQFLNEDVLPFTRPISDMAFRDHKLYITTSQFSTTRPGLFILDTQSGNWTEFDENNSPLWSYGYPNLELDPEGNLWFSNSSFRPADNQSDRLLKFDGENWDTVFTGNSWGGPFTLSNDGIIWTATWNYVPGHDPVGYIKKYENGSWVVMNPISGILYSEDSSPTDILVDLSGNIWIGTHNVGVYKINSQGDTLAHYTACNSGLISNYIREIEIDHSSGNIWFATNKGVSLFTPSSEIIQPSFSTQDEVCSGATARFLNTTSGAESWEWKVNGVPVSTERNLEYVFASDGEYLVELTAFNPQGCATSTSQAITAHPVAGLSAFPQNITECDASWLLCAPAGMAEYEWKRGPVVLSNEQCLRVDQANSGVYELKITDFCGNERGAVVAVALSGACVYPGDLDNNGIVDFRDLLWLGQTFGFFGPARPDQGINWREYPAQDWNGYLPGGANFKFCDADGSGYIDLLDLKAIIVNYLNTHGGYPGLPNPEQSPYSFVPVLAGVDTTLGDNQYKLNIDIVARNANGLGINNFYGAGMRMYYVLPPGVQLVGTPEFSFNNSSLDVDSINAIGLAMPFNSQGFMDVALTRVDHVNQSGFDTFGQATFIIEDDHLPIFDSLEFTLSLVGSTAITNEGNFIPVGGEERTFTFAGGQIVDDVTEETDGDNQVLIYPNPTTGRCHLSLPHSPAREVAIQVLNAQGTEVWATASTGQALFYEIDLSALPAGIYWLVATTERSRLVRKIVKM